MQMRQGHDAQDARNGENPPAQPHTTSQTRCAVDTPI